MSIREKITYFFVDNADWFVVGAIFFIGFTLGAVIL